MYLILWEKILANQELFISKLETLCNSFHLIIILDRLRLTLSTRSSSEWASFMATVLSLTSSYLKKLMSLKLLSTASSLNSILGWTSTLKTSLPK